jgi:hypothetical protein
MSDGPISIEIGDVTISSGWGPVGHFLQEGGLIDWYSVPPSKASPESRPQGHGSFDPGPDWSESATPSIKARYDASSRADLQAAKRDLASLRRVEFSSVTGWRKRVTVTDEDGSTSRDVSIRFVDITDDRGRLSFEYAIDMLAPDPLRYGPAVVDSTGLPVAGSGLVWPLGTGGTWLDWGTVGDLGRVDTPNDGTAETYTVLEVTGGMSLGFLLTYVPTGQLISFDREVPPGSTITLDPRRGLAVIDGQSDVTGFLTISDWWPVAAGDGGSIQFASKGVVTGTPTLTARTAPAFI